MTIDSFAALKSELERIARGRAIAVMLSSPAGSTEWRATVSVIDTARGCTASGFGQDALPSGAIEFAIEDIINRGV